MSISDRYGDVAALQALRSNAVIDGLLAHRSVRAYLPDPLPEGTIETLVAAAQSAPTSSNLQVWSVVAVEDPDRKASLAALAGNQKHILEAPLLLVWLIDFDRLTQIGAAAERTPHALDYTESFLLGAIDTALAAQNAVVALEALGLGSVYIGGIRNRPAEGCRTARSPSARVPPCRPGGGASRSCATGIGQAPAAPVHGALSRAIRMERGKPRRSAGL